VAVLEEGLILDKTVFYPEGGGQPGDMGRIANNTFEADVVNTIKSTGGILHLIDNKLGSISAGDDVKIDIDWERRYSLMRMHTALHILCSIVDGAVTGGSVGVQKSRLDFDIPGERPDKESLTQQLMEIVDRNYPVVSSWISDQELQENPDLIRTMSVKPPTGTGQVRMIRIGDAIDFQPCGGTHVNSTGEIGKIKVSKIENKGKQNRRINLTWDN
jgi:misacylated tRNA(Ala) deacylase